MALGASRAANPLTRSKKPGGGSIPLALSRLRRFELSRHITIGVAGHVDHGKTLLVRHLTNVDTDRMPEEKKRGLSIEPGVAELTLPSGVTVSIVDVPGHRDFLRNAIRGLCSVDMGILVVAADDGVMPQTVDHLSVLDLMNASSGIVVLSKADLVDEETLELASLEVNELTAGSFLQDKPLIAFSVVNGAGEEQILKVLDTQVQNIQPKSDEGFFRLWIDQCRSIPGFGTVVSGTVLSGRLRVNDMVQLMPSGKEAKVRFIESHHRRLDEATAGQRVGINLNRISVDEARMGMQLATPGSAASSRILNVEIKLLGSATRPVSDRERVKFYTGSSCMHSMVVPMECPEICPGQTCLAQIRLKEPVSVCPQDPFLISPMNHNRVIGGGRVLELSRDKFRAIKAQSTLAYLKPLQNSDVKSVIQQYFTRFPYNPVTPASMRRETGLPADEILKQLKLGSKHGKYINLNELGYLDKNGLAALETRLMDVLRKVLSQDAFKFGVNSNEIRSRLKPEVEESIFDKIIGKLCDENRLVKTENGLKIPNVKAGLSLHQGEIIKSVMEFARCCGYSTFSPGTFHKLNSSNLDYGSIQRAINFLCSQNKLLKLKDGRVLNAEALPEIQAKIRELILRQGSLSVHDTKSILGYGRTKAIPLLDYLDSIGFTKREGDLRTLKQSYRGEDSVKSAT